MKSDQGMENLLEMHGWIIQQEGGYWVRIEAWKVEPNAQISHGVRYNLTLHDPQHTHIDCKGVPYSFESPAQLIDDFWKAVDNCLREHGVIA